MTNQDIRNAVIRLFEDARQVKDAPFEEDRFLAFLTAEPNTEGNRHRDTFSGCGRFSRFIDAVQLERGVCFSNKELDRGYSLDAFVELVAGKVQDRTSSRLLAHKRLSEDLNDRWMKSIIWSVLAALPLVAPIPFVGGWARYALGAAWVCAAVAIYVYHQRRVAYARTLIEVIEAATGRGP